MCVRERGACMHGKVSGRKDASCGDIDKGLSN